MKFVLSFFIITFLGCSSVTTKEKSQGETFFTQWSKDFYHDDIAYQLAFKNYLYSVEELFNKNNLKHKFGNYLNSLTNFYQLMAHEDYNTSHFYKKLKGRHASLRSRDYENFKIRNLSFHFKRLNAEREKKLKTDLGESFFLKLKSLHQNLANYQLPI